MKKIISRSIAMASILVSTVSYADFQFNTLTGSCADLSGKWQGKGHASNFMVDCYYHGDATITMTDANHFIFSVSVDKDKGSFVCPSHNEQQLMGSCDNGKISIKTDYGTLNGDVTQNQGHANGTLTLIPGVRADVSIDFSR